MVNAQERSQGDIEIIPHIGYSSYFLNGDELDNMDSRGDFHFGVVGDYFFNDRWSLRSGFTYESMGASFFNEDLVLNYISIPVNANWHFGGTRKWNLNFGVSPGFLLNADVSGEDVKDYMESFQLAISYGIGYKIEVSETFSILIDTQNQLGITNIQKEGDLTWLNAGGSFNVGGVFSF